MFQFPYETTPCSGYHMTDIRKALQRALIEGELRPAVNIKNGEPLKGLMEVPPYLKSVAGFSQPFYIETPSASATVIDSRAMVKAKRDGTVRISNPTEYRFLTLRGVLTHAWSMGSPSEQSQFGDFPPTVFSRLITEGLVRRLGLSPLDQMSLSVISTYYYFCLFLPNTTVLEELHRVKMAQRISRATMVAVDKVLNIIDPLPFLTDVESFCRQVVESVPTPRLSKLSPGLLYAIVGGSWFGAHAKENVAVALEYPPTFLAMLYMAMTDRSYHSAFFTKTALNADRRKAGENFTRQVSAFLEEVGYV